jgi:GNAT superfamily N-acetyltransferase
MSEIQLLAERHLPTLLKWINRLPYEYGWDMRALRFRTLEDPTYRPELMLVIEEGGESLAFALGNIRDEQGWIKLFVVRPDLQRQGLGSRLLSGLERRFRKAGVSQITAGRCPLTYFSIGWDARYTEAAAFLHGQGYTRTQRTRSNMWVDLAGRDFSTANLERRLLDQHGIRFRRATAADKEAVIALAGDHSAIWGIEMTLAYTNEPVSLFVADQKGKLCGFGCYGTGGPMYFGPTLTLPALRGLGIGTVTLKRCLADMQRLGWRRIEINSAGPIAFYARAVDARIGRLLWDWEKEL